MTIDELNQLQNLKTFIDHEQERLEDLHESIDVKSPIITDMPKKPGATDKLGETVPKIVDEEQLIKENLAIYSRLWEKLILYIHGVTDIKVKLIMTLRFVDGKSWNEVADVLDKGNGIVTADSVRMAVTNYLKREEGCA